MAQIPYPRVANYLPSFSGNTYEDRPTTIVVEADFVTCNN